MPSRQPLPTLYHYLCDHGDDPDPERMSICFWLDRPGLRDLEGLLETLATPLWQGRLAQVYRAHQNARVYRPLYGWIPEQMWGNWCKELNI